MFCESRPCPTSPPNFINHAMLFVYAPTCLFFYLSLKFNLFLHTKNLLSKSVLMLSLVFFQYHVSPKCLHRWDMSWPRPHLMPTVFNIDSKSGLDYMKLKLRFKKVLFYQYRVSLSRRNELFNITRSFRFTSKFRTKFNSLSAIFDSKS